MNRRRVQPTVSGNNETRSLKIDLPQGLTDEQRQRDAAEYLADIILELRNLARTVNLHAVMVPLEYAYYEAFSAAHRIDVPEGEIERLKRLARVGEDGDQRAG